MRIDQCIGDTVQIISQLLSTYSMHTITRLCVCMHNFIEQVGMYVHVHACFSCPTLRLTLKSEAPCWLVVWPWGYFLSNSY